ncbi:MAG: hypothetical protein ABI353_01710 [Isosphaeraceae bacterium]
MSQRDDASCAVSMVLNRFATESDEAFAATIDNLRIELAPTTILESLWIEMALMAIKRLRKSARDESDDSPTDACWIRYQSMAERSLNNATKRLEKLRRQAAPAKESASALIPRSIPIRSVTPLEPAKPAEATKLAMVAAPAKADTSTITHALKPAIRNEVLEIFRDDVAQMLTDGVTPGEILHVLPELTLDDLRVIQADLPLLRDPNSLRHKAILAR